MNVVVRVLWRSRTNNIYIYEERLRGMEVGRGKERMNEYELGYVTVGADKFKLCRVVWQAVDLRKS